MIRHSNFWKREAGSRKREKVFFPASSLQPPASSRTRGFTLVELLITTALVALVGATVVAAVSGCLRVWQRVQNYGTQDAWTEVTFQSIRQDLHNLRHFEPVGFDGSSDKLFFTGLVDNTEIGQVGYYFDSHRRTLCRAEIPYRLMRRHRVTDTCNEVLNGLSRVKFSYYVPATETQEAGWKGSWEGSGPPLAVKVEVQYHERTFGRGSNPVLLIQIPLATHR